MDEQDNFSCFQWSQTITFLVCLSLALLGFAEMIHIGSTIFWLIITALAVNIVLTVYAIIKYGAKEAFSYLEFLKNFRGRGGGGPN